MCLLYSVSLRGRTDMYVLRFLHLRVRGNLTPNPGRGEGRLWHAIPTYSCVSKRALLLLWDHVKEGPALPAKVLRCSPKANSFFSPLENCRSFRMCGTVDVNKCDVNAWGCSYFLHHCTEPWGWVPKQWRKLMISFSETITNAIGNGMR